MLFLFWRTGEQKGYFGATKLSLKFGTRDGPPLRQGPLKRSSPGHRSVLAGATKSQNGFCKALTPDECGSLGKFPADGDTEVQRRLVTML